METNAVQQEILLSKKSSLAKRELFVNNVAPENKQNLSPDEQLEAACWSGWLDAMLPEIIDTTDAGKNLYLWQILQSKSFLNIELCEAPQIIDVQHSINPYAVMATMSHS